ncbi:hypothetical protein D3C85_1447410 [compost metagenome]
MKKSALFRCLSRSAKKVCSEAASMVMSTLPLLAASSTLRLPLILVNTPLWLDRPRWPTS